MTTEEIIRRNDIVMPSFSFNSLLVFKIFKKLVRCDIYFLFKLKTLKSLNNSHIQESKQRSKLNLFCLKVFFPLSY